MGHDFEINFIESELNLNLNCFLCFLFFLDRNLDTYFEPFWMAKYMFIVHKFTKSALDTAAIIALVVELNHQTQ